MSDVRITTNKNGAPVTISVKPSSSSKSLNIEHDMGLYYSTITANYAKQAEEALNQINDIIELNSIVTTDKDQNISGDKTFIGNLQAITQETSNSSNLVATTEFVANNVEIINSHMEEIESDVSNKAENDLSNLTSEGEKHFVNKTQLTNCAIEIPHRIKYTHSNGIFTLKTGSVLIVPYGTEDLSSTYTVGSTFLNANFKVVDTQYSTAVSVSPYANTFFVWVEVQNDIVFSSVGLSADGMWRMLFVNIANNTLQAYVNNTAGAGASSITTGNVYHYNTTDNMVQVYSNSVLQLGARSLPVMMIYDDGNYMAAKVNNIFNGMYHIGNCIFIDRGFKALVADGYNEDGTINNTLINVKNLCLRQSTLTGIPFIRLQNGTPRYYLINYTNYLGELPSEPSIGATFQWYFNTSEMKWYSHEAGETVWTNVPYYNLSDIRVYSGNTYDYTAPYPVYNCHNYLPKNGGVISAKQSTGGAGVLTIESNQWGSLLIKNDNITNGSVVSNTVGQYMGIDYRDSNNARVGFFGVVQPKNNDTPYVEIQTSNGGGFNFPKCTTKATTTSSAANNRVGVLIENYKNGASWYRVWSDGWIEQGGEMSGNSGEKTVTFLKPFSDTNYTVSMSYKGGTQRNTNTVSTEEIQAYSISASGFTSYLDQNLTKCWYACGY